LTAPAVCFSIQVPGPLALRLGACDFDFGSRQGPFEGPPTRKASGFAGGYLLANCQPSHLTDRHKPVFDNTCIALALGRHGDKTRVLQYRFNWKIELSAMAEIRGWNFYFRAFPGAIRSPQIIEFLAHLLRHIPGKLLIFWVIWDGLPGHRSRATWGFIRKQRGASCATACQ
jgi:hypothetical protein